MTDLVWVVSDSLKIAGCVAQFLWLFFYESKTVNVHLTSMRRLTTFQALLLVVYIFGLHEPFYYGWEASITLNTIAVGNLLGLVVILVYLVSLAAYSLVNITIRIPSSATSSLIAAIIFPEVLFVASLIATIVTDDNRWAALRQVTAGLTILVCGFYYICCLVRLRSYVLQGILENSNPSQTTNDKQPLNYSNKDRKHDKEYVANSPTSKSDYTRNGTGPPNNKNFSVHSVASGQHQSECVEESHTATSVKMKPLQTIVSEAKKRRLLTVKQYTYAKKRLACLLISAIIIVPITGLSILAFTFTIVQRDASVSEEQDFQSRNYSAGSDLGIWFLVIGNLYFLYYVCKNQKGM